MNNTQSQNTQTKIADAQTEAPDLEMKNLYVAQCKKGYPRCLLLHAEGVDREPMARYDRFEMKGQKMQLLVRVTVKDALFLQLLGSMAEEVGKLYKDCSTVYAGVQDKKSAKWIDEMVQFLQDSKERVYRHIV
jgi:hypothetical protein